MAFGGNPFIGDDMDYLLARRDELRILRSSIATVGSSYSLAGRSYSFTDLPAVNEEYGQVREAIDYGNGLRSDIIYGDLRG